MQVTMNVEDSLVLLSDEMYACTQGLAMPIPQLQMALKSAEHSMGMCFCLICAICDLIPRRDVS